jgi:hypothetical protein
MGLDTSTPTEKLMLNVLGDPEGWTPRLRGTDRSAFFPPSCPISDVPQGLSMNSAASGWPLAVSIASII